MRWARVAHLTGMSLSEWLSFDDLTREAVCVAIEDLVEELKD
ncbi:hypothetical protein SAMN02745219_02933 [Desulfofundulus thermosubterraneus DSM 16057]|uniref:Uncharacterized protein n=1 Tax=Desulfofundulus thermosubterraneus DSM 16057 TaxID=1121432 RepID=A0A1M6KN63_9FIRM|nr:hypothetical protein SAMN02745219_02933 [Desulfofundulus thermosubterraneus DSM 16057]